MNRPFSILAVLVLLASSPASAAPVGRSEAIAPQRVALGEALEARLGQLLAFFLGGDAEVTGRDHQPTLGPAARPHTKNGSDIDPNGHN